MPKYSNSYSKKVDIQKKKKKEKKNRSTLNKTLHSLTIQGSVLAVLQIIFIVLFLVGYKYRDSGKLSFMQKIIANPLAIVIIFSAFVVIDSMFLIFNISKMIRSSHKNDLEVATIIGQDAKEAYDFSKLGLVVVDNNDIVIWMNEFLAERQMNIFDMNIYSVYKELTIIKDGTEETARLKINNNTYDVEYLRDSHLFLFHDVSDYAEEHAMALKEAVVMGKLVIDTYDEFSKILETKKFNDMVLQTRFAIDKYFSEHGALAIKSNEDEYLIVCNYENFSKMVEERFGILKIIQENAHGDDAKMMTISIGFAHGFNESIISLENKATRACSTALRRGGDQIIVMNSEGQSVFGGKNKVERQQNMVKYRTYAQSLSSSIREASKVIIAGHLTSDMDSLGSSLGFYAFVKSVRRNNGESVPAYVVFDTNSSQSNTLTTYQMLRNQMKTAFVSPNDVAELIDDKALVILTDVYNPMGSLLCKLFDRNSRFNTPNKVIVFDHHMKNTKETDITPILECIDPSISSCSEMVTHLLQYAEEDLKIEPIILDTLLSGIMLDTGFFKNRVDTTTYLACNLLVQRGAKSENASNMLKEAYETYQLKCGIVSNTSTSYDSNNFYISGGLHIFIVCATDPKSPDVYLDDDILAKVADEHVATKDVDACFVIGQVGDHVIKVSARGNGKYNVQRITENVEGGYGGGEFDRAAVVFKNPSLTLEDVYDLIKNKIMEFDELDQRRGGVQ